MECQSGRVPDEIVAALARSVASAMPRHVATLSRLVAVPGIAWPAFDPEQLECSAREVREVLIHAGLPDAGIIRADGPEGAHGAPAVVAGRPPAPGMPTVLLYAHHDVQPAGATAEWATDPFSLTERGGRMWGRGAADDKAGILMHVAALEALDDVLGPGNGLGLTFFIEGEEESGSPSLPALLDHLGQRLAADAAVVADSGSWKIGTPALTTSLRGLVDGTIEVRILDHALHSGTYGGPVLDALTALARLMASFHHADGSVAVEGLTLADSTSLEIPEPEFRREAGLPPRVRLAGSGTLASRLWTKPALSFIGLDAPAISAASNTLLPAAAVKFSLRLAPGTNPDEAMEAVRRHARYHMPFGAEMTFTPGSKSLPFVVDPENIMVDAALWALGEAWGTSPVTMGVGGSIPFVAALTERYPDCPVLLTGAEDPDSRAHGANESVHRGELEKAILAEALFLAAVSRMRDQHKKHPG
jgi:cysteinylglycine-S-conjugate dipeptidase